MDPKGSSPSDSWLLTGPSKNQTLDSKLGMLFYFPTAPERNPSGRGVPLEAFQETRSPSVQLFSKATVWRLRITFLT